MNGLIDVHHHISPASYNADVGDSAPPARMIAGWTVEKSLADMAAGGVAKAIVSMTTPGVYFNGDGPRAARIARRYNEYAAGLAAQYPGKFGLFAAVAMPDIDATLAEIAYALDTLHADGIQLFTSYGDAWLGDASFAPVWEELDRRGAIVFVHPLLNACCTRLVPDTIESTIEYATDTTRTIADLCLSGTASRFPNIRFIFSHCGGTLPFLIERFTNLAKKPELAARMPNGILYEIKKFHYDTAQASHVTAMAAVRTLLPAAQLLYGTDFPYRKASEYLGTLAACGFDAAEIAAIGYGNAERLLAEKAPA
jgi:predicted TIM-barrel fold metal-dependent hydrolase